MKKIVCLIKPRPPLLYFVNQIHRHFPVHTVIVEDTDLGSLPALKKAKTKIALGDKAIQNPHVPLYVKSRKLAETYTQTFNDDWLDLDKSLRVVYCKNINDEKIEKLLEQEKPDLLLDHGTSIVKNHIIEKAPLALNLHWGLSPYYRGTHCTEWALINWDPLNIGVTIHRLAKAIDGGDVLGQGRVTVEPGDTATSINMKLTRTGTQIILDVLKDWQEGVELEFSQQDFSRGYLALNRQWGHLLRKEIQRIEREGVISQMLKTPSRREELPIVEYKPARV